MSRPLRRRDARFQRDMPFGPHLTPLADVVLVILIFFMASAALLAPEWLLRAGLAAPEPDQPGETIETTEETFDLPEAVLVFRIEPGREGDVSITGAGRDSMDADELEAVLRPMMADDASIVVVLEPDEEAPYEAVLRAHEACTNAGVQRVQLR